MYLCVDMFRRLILILLTVLLSCACSCGPKKQHKGIITETASNEQIATEDFNKVGEKLQEFLSNNGKPLKGWPFKEWGWRLVGGQMVFKMTKGEDISGDVLKEFLSLDQVKHYNSHLNRSRDEWIAMLFDSDDVYKYCGTLDVSDSLSCYIYTVENKKEVAYHDAFALIVKDNSAVGSVQLACEGYGLGDSIKTNRISRNTFIMSSFAVDVIDENGDSPGGYYSIRINDDGTISRFNAYESDFNKPTWN